MSGGRPELEVFLLSPHKCTAHLCRYTHAPTPTHMHSALPGISSSPIMWVGGPAFPGTAGLSLWLGWSTRIDRTRSRGRARTMARVSSRMGSGEKRSLRCRARRRHPAWPDRARRLSSRRKILEPRPMARKSHVGVSARVNIQRQLQIFPMITTISQALDQII